MRPGLQPNRQRFALPDHDHGASPQGARRADAPVRPRPLEDAPHFPSATAPPGIRWPWWLAAVLCGLALWGVIFAVLASL